MENFGNFYLLKYRLYIYFFKYKLLNCFFASVRRNIVESLYKNGGHWPTQKYIKAKLSFFNNTICKITKIF